MCAYKGLVLDPGGWCGYRAELSLSETLGRFLCSLKLGCGDGSWASDAQIVAMCIYLGWNMRLFRWRLNGCATEEKRLVFSSSRYGFSSIPWLSRVHDIVSFIERLVKDFVLEMLF